MYWECKPTFTLKYNISIAYQSDSELELELSDLTVELNTAASDLCITKCTLIKNEFI